MSQSHRQKSFNATHSSTLVHVLINNPNNSHVETPKLSLQ